MFISSHKSRKFNWKFQETNFFYKKQNFQILEDKTFILNEFSKVIILKVSYVIHLYFSLNVLKYKNQQFH